VFRDATRRDALDCLNGLIDGWRRPIDLVPREELDERQVGHTLVSVGEGVVARETGAQHCRFVDEIWIELDIAVACGGCVERRLGESDARPARDRLGRYTKDSLGDQQVVGEVEVRERRSAGEPLEYLAIPVHDRFETISERLVRSLPRDVLGDRLADSFGDADPLRPRDSFELLSLLACEPECHVPTAHCASSVA